MSCVELSCFDCHKSSYAGFSIIGPQCPECNSTNVSLDFDEGFDDDEDDDECTDEE